MKLFLGLTSDRKVLYSLSFSLFAILLSLLFIPGGIARYVCAAFLAAMTIAICLLISKRSILSINKREVLLLLAVIGFLYLTAYYLTGTVYGFYSNPYFFTLGTIPTHILPITVIIITTEITRRVLLAQKNTLVSILTYLSAVMAEVLSLSSTAGVNTFNQFMDLVGIIILPALTSNILYCYTSAKYGAMPVLVYRLIRTLHIYLIPVSSLVPQSMLAFVELFLPLAILAFMRMLYESKGRKKIARPTWLKNTVTALAVFLMILVVMLISCQFEYALVVVGSESMTGEINKGDAVIYEDYDANEDVNEGDVLIFNKEGVQTIHRVSRLEYVNGQKRYYTKGDANTHLDSGYITDSDIIGIAKFKIAYIGYPTIWVRAIFES